MARGERICRECGSPVTGRRLTWCSSECVLAYQERCRPVRVLVFERDGGKCALCGVTSSDWEADHTVPLCEGGPHSLENMRTLCAECHKGVTAALNARRFSGRRPKAPVVGPRLPLESSLD